jgi:hypothetical protein
MVALGPNVTGGSFTVCCEVNGVEYRSKPLAWDASPEQLQAALEGLLATLPVRPPWFTRWFRAIFNRSE